MKGMKITGSTVVVAIISLVGIGVAGVVGVSLTGGDTTPLLSTIAGLIAPVVGVLVLLLKVDQVQTTVNGNTTKLMEAHASALAAKDDQIAELQSKIPTP